MGEKSKPELGMVQLTGEDQLTGSLRLFASPERTVGHLATAGMDQLPPPEVAPETHASPQQPRRNPGQIRFIIGLQDL